MCIIVCASCFGFILHADIAELNLPKTCQLEFADPDNLLNFKLIICPDEVCMYSIHILSSSIYIPGLLSNGEVCIQF